MSDRERDRLAAREAATASREQRRADPARLVADVGAEPTSLLAFARPLPRVNRLRAIGNAASRSAKRAALLDALERHGWVITHAAADLGMPSGTASISRELHRLGLWDEHQRRAQRARSRTMSDTPRDRFVRALESAPPPPVRLEPWDRDARPPDLAREDAPPVLGAVRWTQAPHQPAPVLGAAIERYAADERRACAALLRALAAERDAFAALAAQLRERLDALAAECERLRARLAALGGSDG